MPTRDDLFSHFGPLLLEATAMAFLDQINLVRSKTGMPQITYQQAANEILNNLSNLEPYGWMKNPNQKR